MERVEKIPIILTPRELTYLQRLVQAELENLPLLYLLGTPLQEIEQTNGVFSPTILSSIEIKKTDFQKIKLFFEGFLKIFFDSREYSDEYPVGINFIATPDGAGQGVRPTTILSHILDVSANDPRLSTLVFQTGPINMRHYNLFGKAGINTYFEIIWQKTEGGGLLSLMGPSKDPFATHQKIPSNKENYDKRNTILTNSCDLFLVCGIYDLRDRNLDTITTARKFKKQVFFIKDTLSTIVKSKLQNLGCVEVETPQQLFDLLAQK